MRIGRSIYEAMPALRVWSRYGRPDYILRFDGGIGDDLLCSAVVRELRQRGARRIWMLTDYPELFEHNPDVILVARKNRGMRQFIEFFKFPQQRVSYAPHVNGRDLPPDKHIINTMCENLNIKGPITRRPYVHLSTEEKLYGVFGSSQIAIQSSGLSAKYAAKTKEWYPERFQQLVTRLAQDHTLVQIGSIKDPVLLGAIDMRGRTSIRQTAAILHNSKVFVGLVGFLQHLARSVDCRSVIVFGGRELPKQSAYECNENVTNNPPCSPCWIYDGCNHGMRCMDEIQTEIVVRAVETQLARWGQPLLPETALV